MADVKLNFRGLMAPVFTPFHNDGNKNLNLTVIPDYARYLASNGIKGVLVNGTSGEATTQTVEEREMVAEAWVKAANLTEQSVMVQVGGTNIRDVQRLAAHAQRTGASSILCLADLSHRPKTPEDVVEYLNLVSAHAPTLPLLYYHLPGFTGIDVDMYQLMKIAHKIPTFAGIKYTSNDLDKALECLTVNDGGYAVFLGSDTLLMPAAVMGFDSAIGTTLNMMASLNTDIMTSVKNRDLDAGVQSQKTLTSAIKTITKHGGWVSSMKSAMNLMTPIRVGPVREPILQVNPRSVETMRQELAKLGL